MPDLYLTFDIEDFINEKAFSVLKQIINILDTAQLKGLFFITGHVADKLNTYPEIVNTLENHEIGYHSSAHSVRPLIIEYTDIENYDQAIQTALTRETSRISPITGKILGPGGLLSLKKLFPKKIITSFRAPGFGWSPPIIEALGKLGIQHDFSTRLKTGPFKFKKIQFYPFPTVLCPPDGYPFNLRTLSRSIRKSLPSSAIVLLLHPTTIANQEHWDSIYFQGNPPELIRVKERNPQEEKAQIKDFTRFIDHIKTLKKIGVIDVTPPFKNAKPLTPDINLVNQMYLDSVLWVQEHFNYKPQFISTQFQHFFLK